MKKTILLSGDQNQSRSEPGPKPGNALNCEPESYGPLTFERWLLSLLASPELLALEAKKLSDFALQKNALHHWQEAGCPHPGEWPDNYGETRASFVEKWMGLWVKSKANPAKPVLFITTRSKQNLTEPQPVPEHTFEILGQKPRNRALLVQDALEFSD